ncbi:MAG TPA: glycosyltransferase [Pyrinomonadaceae bacterium]|nr:glycosyltransferase [Pyrinomonadaceae bacterium]
MITGRDILYISSIEWDFLWQAHQEIARRLAAAGNRVLYIENTGVRAPGLKDTKRVASRLGRWLRSLRSGGAREVSPNIFVYSPLVLPPFGPSWQRFLNRRVFLRQLRSITKAMGITDPLLWTYLPTDTAVDIIRLHKSSRSVVVYYSMADFSLLTPNRSSLEKSEKDLVSMSDVVFANCSALANKLSTRGKGVPVFPPGVDMSAFPEWSTTEKAADPLNLDKLPRPIIGYVGGLHRLVDYDLLVALAHSRPSWSWVFLGAHQVQLDQLKELPNVYLLGQQAHGKLAEHMWFFDVCLVPYLNTLEMKTVVPTKINEYLAAGKAIVSTNLPTVDEFNQRHQILFTANPTRQDFLRAIEAALPTAHDGLLQKRRRAVAQQANWETRLEEMSQLIEANLASPTAGPKDK